MITKFECPLCSSPLIFAIRVRESLHVLFCPNMDTHGYIEGTGETQDKAFDDIKKKAKGKQKELL